MKKFILVYGFRGFGPWLGTSLLYVCGKAEMAQWKSMEKENYSLDGRQEAEEKRRRRRQEFPLPGQFPSDLPPPTELNHLTTHSAMNSSVDCPLVSIVPHKPVTFQSPLPNT